MTRWLKAFYGDFSYWLGTYLFAELVVCNLFGWEYVLWKGILGA